MTGFQNAIIMFLLEKLKCASSKYDEVLCTYLYGSSVCLFKSFLLVHYCDQ
jgi:predicted nucleotidyltransferase